MSLARSAIMQYSSEISPVSPKRGEKERERDRQRDRERKKRERVSERNREREASLLVARLLVCSLLYGVFSLLISVSGCVAWQAGEAEALPAFCTAFRFLPGREARERETRERRESERERERETRERQT